MKLANLKPAWSKIYPSVLPQNSIQLLFVCETTMLALIATSPVACGLSYTITIYNVRSYQFSTFLQDQKSEILIHLPQPKIQIFRIHQFESTRKQHKQRNKKATTNNVSATIESILF